MRLTLFGQPREDGCCCATDLDRLRASLEQREVPHCPVHDGDLEHQARESLHRRMIAEHRAATAAAEGEVEPPSSGDPLRDSLERVVGIRPIRRPAPSLPLNAPASAYPSLAGFSSSDHEPPPAA